MANIKISELPEITQIADDDYYPAVDTSGNVTGRVTVAKAGIGATTYTMTGGQTTLIAGTHIKKMPIEVIFLGATAAETLQMINGSWDGNLKFIVATNDNVTIQRNDSYIKTKNPLANPAFAMSTGDCILLANTGGNPDSSLNGTWIEVFRALQV